MIWNFSFSKNIFCRGLDIRVPQIVNPNAFDTCLFCAALHFVIEIVLGDGKEAIRLSDTIERLDVVLYFISEKFRHPTAWLRIAVS